MALGRNTYTGSTTVNAGTLQVAGSLASGSALTVGSAGTAAFLVAGQTLGTVTLNGQINLDAGSGVTTISVLNGASTGRLTFGSASTVNITRSTSEFAGRIDGAGILVKAGSPSDTLTLTNGDSNYSGGTSLEGGSIGLGASSTVAGGVITGGPLGTGLLTLSTGTVLNGVGAPQTIHNQFQLGGSISIGGQSLTLSNAGLTAATPVTLTANSTLTIATGVELDVAKSITDGAQTFSLVKAGSGTLTLGSSNTYTGTTTISAGTLG